MVYLICFDRKHKHARHYIGWARDEYTFKKRIENHKKGRGARLLDVINKQGIGWTVVRTWPEGDRNFERKLKNQKKSSALCPCCKAAKKAEKQCPVINATAINAFITDDFKKNVEIVVTPANQEPLTEKVLNELIVKARLLYAGEPKSPANPSRWSRIRNTLARFWQFLTSQCDTRK